MADSTFPVWAAILLFGGVLLYLLSYINVYVPKDQKEKAKNMRTMAMQKVGDDADIFVIFKIRFKGLWYLIIPGLFVLLPSSVAFFVSDFSDFVQGMPTSGELKKILALIVFIFGFFFAEIICVILMFAGEEMAIAGEQSYYSKRYGMLLVSEEEYDRWLKQ